MADNAPASFSRNTAVVASGTLLSRLTGFGRVLALVWAFHVTRLGDIYNIANTVPNILYDLLLGGVLSATLIPVFVDYLGRDDEDEAWRAISAICTVITASLVVLSAIFWLLVPYIIRFYLIFNHTAGAADERAIGTTLLRLFVPQLFLLGGIAVTTALLNTRRKFGAAAFSPVLNNLICIAAIVATRLVAGSLDLAKFRHDRTALLILGLGTTAGYLVQLIIHVPALMRGHFGLRPRWEPGHPAVRTVLRLSLWTFGAVLANQVAFNLVLIIAGKKSGDVVVFTTAYQFFQLPYAIFAVSIAAVVTPDLSDRWAKGDVAGFRRQMAGGLRLTLAILVPAAVGYVALAHPFLTLIFHHGSFSSHDAHKIGTVVALFAIGLPGFSAYLLLMRAYQAMQDTKSMFWLYVIENGATIVLAAALYPALGVGGLALGWVSAYSIGSIVAFFNLRQRTGGLQGAATARTLTRVAVATAVMFAAVWAVRLAVGTTGSDIHLAVTVGAGAIVGAVIYIVVCRFLGVSELDVILRRRRRRGAHWAGRRA
jgi:putative peptidoglycan lipid II flippase